MADFDGEDVVLIGGKALSRNIILTKLTPMGWTREDVAHMNDEEVKAALGGARPGQLVLADDPARRKVDLQVVTGEQGKRMSAHVDLLNENQPAVDVAAPEARPGQPRIIVPGQAAPQMAPQPTMATPQAVAVPAAPAFSPHARPAPAAPIPMPAPTAAPAAAFSPHAPQRPAQPNLQFPTPAAAPAPAPAPRPWTPPVPQAQPVATMSALPPGVPPCRVNFMQLRSVMDAVAQLAQGGEAALPVARNLLETHQLSDAFRAYNPAVWQMIYPGVQATAHEWCLGSVLMTIDGGANAFHFVTTDGIITVHGQNLQIARS